MEALEQFQQIIEEISRDFPEDDIKRTGAHLFQKLNYRNTYPYFNGYLPNVWTFALLMIKV